MFGKNGFEGVTVGVWQAEAFISGDIVIQGDNNSINFNFRSVKELVAWRDKLDDALNYLEMFLGDAEDLVAKAKKGE
jgi:hypothetical protein